MLYLNKFIWLVVAVLLFLSLLFFLYPDHRTHLIEEDAPLENLTVLLYVMTALTALASTLIVRNAHTRLLLILFIIAVIAALEEISYGVRIFDLTAPRLLDFKIDGLHDFYFLFFKALKELYEAYGMIIIAASSLFTVVAIYLLWRLWQRFSTQLFDLVRQPPVFYLMMFVLFGLIALSLDLGLIRHDYLKLLEESFELNGAVALLFAVITAMKLPKAQHV